MQRSHAAMLTGSLLRVAERRGSEGAGRHRAGCGWFALFAGLAFIV